MKNLNIGLIGYGFMGRAHSNAFRKAGNFFDLPFQPVLKAACGRDAGKVQAFAKRWGYESCETDWRKLVQRQDIDLIDIACPNDMHMEIAIAVARAGKMILCMGLAKPLFPLKNPGIISIPLGFLAVLLGSLLFRSRRSEEMWPEVYARQNTGILVSKAASH